MFGFNNVKVNAHALAVLLEKRSKAFYSVKQVESSQIILTGKYRDRQREHRLLYLSVKGDKVFFMDALGNTLTHIKQGVKEQEVLSCVNEIFNIVH